VAFNNSTCNVEQELLNDFLELEIYAMPSNKRGNKYGIWRKHLCVRLHKIHFNSSNILIALELKLNFSETNEYVTDVCLIFFLLPYFVNFLLVFLNPHTPPSSENLTSFRIQYY
jgi:hypothetical protein